VQDAHEAVPARGRPALEGVIVIPGGIIGLILLILIILYLTGNL
jgi:hypothetical protein